MSRDLGWWTAFGLTGVLVLFIGNGTSVEGAVVGAALFWAIFGAATVFDHFYRITPRNDEEGDRA